MNDVWKSPEHKRQRPLPLTLSNQRKPPKCANFGSLRWLYRLKNIIFVFMEKKFMQISTIK